jgi:hypothetical protein
MRRALDSESDRLDQAEAGLPDLHELPPRTTTRLERSLAGDGRVRVEEGLDAQSVHRDGIMHACRRRTPRLDGPLARPARCRLSRIAARLEDDDDVIRL